MASCDFFFLVLNMYIDLQFSNVSLHCGLDIIDYLLCLSTPWSSSELFPLSNNPYYCSIMNHSVTNKLISSFNHVHTKVRFIFKNRLTADTLIHQTPHPKWLVFSSLLSISSRFDSHKGICSIHNSLTTISCVSGLISLAVNNLYFPLSSAWF